MTKFVPLTMELIDEGQFLEDIDGDFADLQQKLIAFCRTYGDDAEKAKAVLNIKMTVAVESIKDERFSVKSETKTTMPQRPATISMALAEETQDEIPLLHVRASGADSGNPRQKKFARRDGSMVDDDNTGMEA